MSKEVYTPPPTKESVGASPIASGGVQSFGAVPPRPPAAITYLCAGKSQRVPTFKCADNRLWCVQLDRTERTN